MHKLVALVVAAVAVVACGPAEAPASSPGTSSSAAAGPATPSPAEPAPAAPAPAPAAPAPAAPAPAPARAPAASSDGVTASVTVVQNEVTTPNVVTPDKVIASLRPKLNACYQEGLKKSPTLEGSVTLSAKIEKDGSVSAVTPKNVTGLNPAVLKCLGDQLKAASFAAAGGMNYTTSIDIPVSFAATGH
jgi:hypothetical protein